MRFRYELVVWLARADAWEAGLCGWTCRPRLLLVTRRGWVARVNEVTGEGLVFDGESEQGETAGAVFVRWPDGRAGVLTRSTVDAARARQTAEVLVMARAAGVPVPRHERVLDFADGVVLVVQERLVGAPAAVVDERVVDAVIAVNERFAGLLAGRPDVPLAAPDAAPALDWGEALEHHSPRSRRLRRRLAPLTGAWTGRADDLVHPDLTTPNVLFDADGGVSGVVDWNGGAFRGDRRAALVKLLFDSTWDAACPGGFERVRPEALERLEEHVRGSLDADRLRQLWAWYAVTMADWTIRSRDPLGIEVHLALGEREFG